MKSLWRARFIAGSLALPLALWAAVPGIRECPQEWQRVCATAPSPCTALGTAVDYAAAIGHCPLAEAMGSGASHAMCGGHAACPLARSAPARRAPAAPGRVRCVGGPNGGIGVSAHAPALHSVPQPAAIVTATAPDVALARTSIFGIARPGRPPPEPWFRSPPARAPPASRSI
jgi:hypothetical protein